MRPEDQQADPFAWLSEGENVGYVEAVERTLKDLGAFFKGHGCGPDAEALVQETLLALFKALKENRGKAGTIQPGVERRRYLFGIANNVLSGWIKDQTRRVSLFLPPGQETLDLQNIASPATAEQLSEAEASAIHDFVWNGLRELSPSDRAVLIATDLASEKIALHTLAREKNVPPANLRQQKSRARRRLQDVLEREGEKLRHILSLLKTRISS